MTTTVKYTGQVTITTRFRGPTNTRGSRIIATANGQRVTIACDNALSVEQRHAKAAQALCDKLGWSGTLAQGGTDNGYVFVFVDPQA